MIRILLFAGMMVFFSCSVRKARGHLKEEEGYTYYVLRAPQMRVQLYGDYRFHTLRKRHFTDVDKSFLNYATSKVNTSAPRRMFAAHTFVAPFYSIIAIMYKGERAHDRLLNQVKQNLAADLKTTYHAVDSFYTNMGTAFYFSYPLSHPITGDTSWHREFFINHQEDVFRFHFWTTKGDTSIVFREAETILKNIR